METNRIRQFCAVVEMENLRKAGELLGMSHSALSKSLKVLQNDIQKQLLMQVGRNIVITEEGRLFYKRALEFLKQEHVLLTKDIDAKEVVRIGTFEVFSTHLLGTTWSKYFQGTELNLRELLRGKLEEALIQNEIDYGITYDPVPMKGVEFVLLGKVEMGIFAKQGAYGAHTKLADINFVAPINPIEGNPTGMKGLDGWPDDLHPRKISYRVEMMESGLALVKQGSAAIFIPHFVATKMNLCLNDDFKLKEIPLPKLMKPVKRGVYLMKRNNQLETKNFRTLAKLIRNECL